MQAKQALTAAVALLGFLVVGAAIERSAWFEPLRQVLRDPTVDREALQRGSLGRILKGEGLVYPSTSRTGDRWRHDERRRVYHAEPARRRSDPIAPAPSLVARGWPVVSVTIDEESLWSEDRGLFTNWHERWEAPAHLAYFDRGRQVFEARCGLRLHGGSSRETLVQEAHGVTWRSVRLYFREEYGIDAAPDDFGFGPENTPLRRLVIRGDSPINSALSFDICRRIGGQAPPMHPAAYTLNGELQGLFSLTIHLDREVWRDRLGHSDFAFHRKRGVNSPEDDAAHAELEAWVEQLEELGVTRAAVQSRVDIDALARHLFAIAWVGGDDWAQGAAVLDRSEPRPLWRWVLWDMDRSFRPTQGGHVDDTWRKPALDLLRGLEPLNDETGGWLERERSEQQATVRARLFNGLLRDDPGFPRDFVDLATELMNHRLTNEYFRTRISAFKRFEGEQGLAAGAIFRVVRFLQKRSEFVREDLARAFELEGPFEVRVVTPADGGALIDGHAWEGEYRGWYFGGQEIAVDANLAGGEGAGGWEIAGQPTVPGGALRSTIDGPLEITWRR